MKTKFDKYKLTRQQMDAFSRLQDAFSEAVDAGIVFCVHAESGALSAINDPDDTVFLSTNLQDDVDYEIPFICHEIIGFPVVVGRYESLCGDISK